MSKTLANIQKPPNANIGIEITKTAIRVQYTNSYKSSALELDIN